MNKIAESKGSGGSSDEGGILFVGRVTTQDGGIYTHTLTKTYREIKNAALAVIVGEGENPDIGATFFRNITLVTSLVEQSNGLYIVNEEYDTDNIDGYPAWREGK